MNVFQLGLTLCHVCPPGFCAREGAKSVKLGYFPRAGVHSRSMLSFQGFAITENPGLGCFMNRPKMSPQF